MLMRYLMDSLIRQEEGHQDALCPVPVDKPCGETDLSQPMTKGDACHLVESVVTVVKTSLQPGMQFQSPGNATAPTTPATITPTVETQAQPPSCGNALSNCRRNTQPSPSGTFRLSESRQQSDSEDQEQSILLPVPGVYVCNISRTRGSWREAVKQWEEGDPSRNILPLKDWPLEWYTGAMRKYTASKRKTRQIITDEYVR